MGPVAVSVWESRAHTVLEPLRWQRAGPAPHSLREKCILSLIILRSGLRRLRIWASTLTVCSLLSPVFLVWNFFSRSLVVIGFRVR